MDHCLRLDLLMHIESRIGLEHSLWTCHLQQSGLCTTEMARHAGHVGYHHLALVGQSLVQEVTQPHPNIGCLLPHHVLLRQHHYPGRPCAA